MADQSFAEYVKANPELRWGQAFCNFFDIRDDTSLFYEVQEESARWQAQKHIDNYQLQDRM